MLPSTANPYESPTAATVDSPASQPDSQFDWKSILKRWEILRIVYNLMVGAVGLLVLAAVPAPFLPEAIGSTIVYGLVANLLYLLGPATQLYLIWFADVWEGRLVPRWLARFVRSRYLTALLFLVGVLFSILLTLAIGLSEAFTMALPNQP